MNKKIISLLMAAAMIAPAAAFAENVENAADNTDIMLISEQEAENTVSNFIGTVVSVDGNIVTVAVETEDGTVDAAYGVTEETPVYDAKGNKVELKKDDKVIVASTASLLTKDIKPVSAILVRDKEEKASIYYSTFSSTEDGFISADKNLVLNIEDEKKAEYEGKTLLVIYEFATMSLPPQTNPSSIIVIDEPSDVKDEVMNSYTGIVKEASDSSITIAVETEDGAIDVNFIITEETKLSSDNNAKVKPSEGDKVEIDSTSELLTKDIKAAAAIRVLNSENKPEAKVSIEFKVGDSVLSINGKDVEVETPYVVGEGTTLVPLRVISEAFGAKVGWAEETETVTIENGDRNIVITIGSKDAKVGEDKAALEEAAELKDGVTMVPLRFISETLGATVSYDDATQGITVAL